MFPQILDTEAKPHHNDQGSKNLQGPRTSKNCDIYIYNYTYMYLHLCILVYPIGSQSNTDHDAADRDVSWQRHLQLDQ